MTCSTRSTSTPPASSGANHYQADSADALFRFWRGCLLVPAPGCVIFPANVDAAFHVSGLDRIPVNGSADDIHRPASVHLDLWCDLAPQILQPVAELGVADNAIPEQGLEALTCRLIIGILKHYL